MKKLIKPEETFIWNKNNEIFSQCICFDNIILTRVIRQEVLFYFKQ